MRRRNNLYWLILAFIAASLTIIFCAATMVIQDRSEKMEQQQEIEAVRLREKREAIAPSSNAICFVTTLYSFGDSFSPEGDTSISRRSRPDFASVIFTGLLVPIKRNALNWFE